MSVFVVPVTEGEVECPRYLITEPSSESIASCVENIKDILLSQTMNSLPISQLQKDSFLMSLRIFCSWVMIDDFSLSESLYLILGVLSTPVKQLFNINDVMANMYKRNLNAMLCLNYFSLYHLHALCVNARDALMRNVAR